MPATPPPPAVSSFSLASTYALASVTTPVPLQLTGTLDRPWTQASAEIVVTGPGAPSSGGTGWPAVFRQSQALGDLPIQPNVRLLLPATAMSRPGAYLVTVTVRASEGRSAATQLWLGRLAPSPPQVDLALLLPIALGVHRAPDGTLLDDTLQAAVSPDPLEERSLNGLLTTVERYPDWHLTLGVEPLLLDAFESMADGYTERVDGRTQKVASSAPGAQNAAQTLENYRRVAGLSQVQIVPGPYALPSMSLLARLDWPDGFEQMRVGKDKVKSILRQPAVVRGAYAPGLDLTTDSMAFFSQSSVDYVVVSTDVAVDLAERPSDLSRPVRVRDAESDRLTLLFANKELRAATGPPWSAERFLAALAQELAAGRHGPFVVAAADDYRLPPGAFLDGVISSLGTRSWLHARTLDEFLTLYPPPTRPVFLTRYGGLAESFVGRSYIERLTQAHATADLFRTASAGSDRAPLARLLALLYTAESRFWFSQDQDPAIVNRGLTYVDAVDEFVRAEFDKVDVASRSVLFVGHEGDVPVAVVNRAGYPLKVDLTLAGDGLTVKGGDHVSVTLGPQENIFTFPVRSTVANGKLRVTARVGDTVIDEGYVEVRALSLRSLLPYVVGLFLVLGGVIALVLRIRS